MSPPPSLVSPTGPGASPRDTTPLLIALNLPDGRELFKVAITRQAQTLSGLVSAGDLVIGYESVCNTPNSGPAAVAAFDARTGQRRWRIPVGEGYEALQHPASLNATDGLVVVQTNQNGILGIDSLTGKELWRATVNVSSVMLAIDDGGPLVLKARVGMTVLDRHTGRTLWSRTDGAVVGMTQDSVISQRGAEITVLDRNTGAQLWVRSERLVGVGDGNLYVSDGTTIVALDARSGTQRWRRADTLIDEFHDVEPYVTPALVTVSAAARTPYSGFDVLDAMTGTPQWHGTWPMLSNGTALGGESVVNTFLLFTNPSAGFGYVVRRLSDGATLGTITLPLPEEDQVTFVPLITNDLTVYAGRGCPGRR